MFKSEEMIRLEELRSLAPKVEGVTSLSDCCDMVIGSLVMMCQEGASEQRLRAMNGLFEILRQINVDPECLARYDLNASPRVYAPNLVDLLSSSIDRMSLEVERFHRNGVSEDDGVDYFCSVAGNRPEGYGAVVCYVDTDGLKFLGSNGAGYPILQYARVFTVDDLADSILTRKLLSLLGFPSRLLVSVRG